MSPKRPPVPPALPAQKRSRAPAEAATRKGAHSGGKAKSGFPAPSGRARAAKRVSQLSTPGVKAPDNPRAPLQGGMGLHTAEGLRKYVTAEEREAFLREAECADRAVRTLCMTLAYAGCRLSEALALTADRVDLGAGVLLLESLKKRRPGVYRGVPVPPPLLDALDMVHGVRELQAKRGRGRSF